MDVPPKPIPELRELSPTERELVRWMLRDAGPSMAPFLAQLADAYVVARCPCGCASLDFAVRGRPLPKGPMRTLADYVFGSDTELAGLFVFEQGGTLGGIEVYSLADQVPKTLPTPEMLRPFDPSMAPEQDD
jgi:hypothetical protein